MNGQESREKGVGWAELPRETGSRPRTWLKTDETAASERAQTWLDGVRRGCQAKPRFPCSGWVWNYVRRLDVVERMRSIGAAGAEELRPPSVRLRDAVEKDAVENQAELRWQSRGARATSLMVVCCLHGTPPWHSKGDKCGRERYTLGQRRAYGHSHHTPRLGSWARPLRRLTRSPRRLTYLGDLLCWALAPQLPDLRGGLGEASG